MLVNLGCVDLGFECSNFECLPDPAWALGSLVDVDGQLGKMEEHPNESQRAAGTQADRWETSSAQSELLYRVGLSICRKVLQIMFWEVPPAEWPIL